MPPSNLPTAASLATAVTGNEFVLSLPMIDESGTQPSLNGGAGNGAGGEAIGTAAGNLANGGNAQRTTGLGAGNGVGVDAISTTGSAASNAPSADVKRAAKADQRKEVPVVDDHAEDSIRDEGCC